MVSFPMLMRMNKSPGDGGGRSSTSSHLSQNYETASAGVAAHEFYGIPLTNDIIREASFDVLCSLGLLLLMVFVKPKIRSLSSPGASCAFWIMMLAAAYSIREVTFYPLVATVISTRTSYPYLVVIPHCIVAAAAYRKERSPHLHYLPSFGLGFFCYGFGGSIVSDVLMGLPATALGHARIVPCYILGWLLVWFSPHDIVYTLLNDKSSLVHYLLSACEAVDAVTTPMGRVSRGARELVNKTTAPIVAGVLAGAGGAVVRYGERVVLRNGGEQVAQESRNALEAGVWRTLWYAVMWWYIAVYKCTADVYDDLAENHCHEFNGRDMDRFVIVMAHVLWNFACDLGFASGHPLVMVSQQVRNIGAALAALLRYGPQPAFEDLKGKMN